MPGAATRRTGAARRLLARFGSSRVPSVVSRCRGDAPGWTARWRSSRRLSGGPDRARLGAAAIPRWGTGDLWRRPGRSGGARLAEEWVATRSKARRPRGLRVPWGADYSSQRAAGRRRCPSGERRWAGSLCTAMPSGRCSFSPRRSLRAFAAEVRSAGPFCCCRNRRGTRSSSLPLMERVWAAFPVLWLGLVVRRGVRVAQGGGDG